MTKNRVRQLALAGIVGPLVFALAAVIGATRVAGYSHVHQFVSELAAVGSDARPVMTVGFFTLGFALLVFAWSVRRLLPAARALVVVIALSGFGTLMAGTFSCDRGCPTTGDRTTHQQLHDTSSVITFSAWIVAPLVAARQLRGTRLARLSLVLGLIALAVSLVLAAYASGGRQPDDPVGLLQRIVLLMVFGWFACTTIELRRVPSPSSDL